MIIGNGTGAKARCIADSSGSIRKIELINSGKNYTETPSFKIEKPNGMSYCNLCCSLWINL